MFGSNYFNKNSILRIEKGPFYFKFCILFNFQDPCISFDFLAHFVCASVKVLDNCNSTDLFCQGLFLCFWDFFSLYLKVIPLLQGVILQSQSRLEKTYFITFALIVAFKIPLCYYSFAGREKYPRGRRGGFAKALGRATGAGVRIPPSPPKQFKKSRTALFPGLFHFRKTQLATKVQQNM